MAKVTVELGSRSYDILVGTKVLTDLGGLIKQHNWGGQIFIITDPLVKKLYTKELTKGLKGFAAKVIVVPRGERYKKLSVAAKIYDQLVRASAHRDALVVALGGGVIGDMAGFVAATYMRGINFIQVPTTLLAQVDAAIGGKTGVNHPNGKNLIGSFYQPKLVFIDVQTLTTLPARELCTGLAEVVKYGIIADADFFKFLEANAHHLNTKAFGAPDTLRAALRVWHIIVTESAKIKAKVVSKDEQESSYRMVLNFGHTIGHAIETLTSYNAYNHGEAVAVGMVAAARLAHKLKMLDSNSVERIACLLRKLGLPTEIKRLSVSAVLRAMAIDKKIRRGQIKFVLPTGIGRVEIRDNVAKAQIRAVLKEMGCS